MNRLLFVTLAFALLPACSVSAPRSAPPAIAGGTIVVLPPNNRTGDPLLVAGASFFEKYALQSDRITVPDVLAAEARQQLARRGFEVIAAERVSEAIGTRVPTDASNAADLAATHQLNGMVLYIEIRRWEADVPVHPVFVIASVEASLIEPSTGRVLWSKDHPSRPIPTPGVVNLGDAYSIAARALVTELVRELGVEQPPNS